MVAHGDRAAPTGQELLAEFVQYGHQKPFEEIVRRYAGMVFNVCVRITKDKHEAEDATQAVFLTLALQAKRGTDIKALGPWLQQVAKRLSLDVRRSKKRRQTREERHQVEQTHRRESILDDALPQADLDELKTVLHEELQKMPTKYRLPLILHYFGGLNRDEMAAELGCKPSTLGVRIFRGREMLAGRLSGRGIHISAGALAVAMGYTVQRAISDSLIAATSYAATALAAGHNGAGLASAHVIGLTRRASSAMALGKIKVAAITLMVAGTSLGASVKAMDMIPAIDVRQIISDQVQRMVRPLFAPFTQPLRVDAQTPATAHIIAAVEPIPRYTYSELQSIVIAQATPMVAAVKPSVAVSVASPTLTIVTQGSQVPAWLRVPWTAVPANRSGDGGAPLSTADNRNANTAPSRSTDIADASVGGAGGGSTGGGGGGAPDMSGGRASSGGNATVATTPALPIPLVIASVNDLIVPPALGKTGASKGTFVRTSQGSTSTVKMMATSTSGVATNGVGGAGVTATEPPATVAAQTTSPASQVQIVQIPARNGSVTETDGTVRGYGQVPRTGTIKMDGKVVADGQGVDRTLDLRSFSSIQSDISNVAAGGSNGWYAVDHGRLSLSLVAGTGSAALTWGENPTDAKLDLVNSVRLSLQSVDANTPIASSLSLLSPDRQDAPNLFGIDGAPIGLWQVDPATGNIAAADITIRYNDTLIAQLGAAESTVSLWTLCSTTDSWSSVDPSTFSLDTINHTVSGFGHDFSYFAVAVPPAPGQDFGYLIAHPQAEVNGVPEPTAIIWLTLGGTFLGRRRQRRER